MTLRSMPEKDQPMEKQMSEAQRHMMAIKSNLVYDAQEYQKRFKFSLNDAERVEILSKYINCIESNLMRLVKVVELQIESV